MYDAEETSKLPDPYRVSLGHTGENASKSVARFQMDGLTVDLTRTRLAADGGEVIWKPRDCTWYTAEKFQVPIPRNKKRAKKKTVHKVRERAEQAWLENIDEGWEGGQVNMSREAGSVVLLRVHEGRRQEGFDLRLPLIHKPYLLDHSYLVTTKTSICGFAHVSTQVVTTRPRIQSMLEDGSILRGFDKAGPIWKEFRLVQDVDKASMKSMIKNFAASSRAQLQHQMRLGRYSARLDVVVYLSDHGRNCNTRFRLHTGVECNETMVTAGTMELPGIGQLWHK
ncbi:hypothetical protein B0H13DRAFT_1902229 [Mycena leptocephala]|nr:hypothetical protein B0H13DRAFT_1902229 [Mycena leptocephala]